MQVIGAVAVRSTSPREKVNAEMIWGAPTPSPPLISALFLMQSSCVSPVESLLTGEGGGDGGGTKSYDGDPL